MPPSPSVTLPLQGAGAAGISANTLFGAVLAAVISAFVMM